MAGAQAQTNHSPLTHQRSEGLGALTQERSDGSRSLTTDRGPLTTAGVEQCSVLAGNIVPSSNVDDPTSFDLRGVTALSASDIWAVGSCSGGDCSGWQVQQRIATLHWDGFRWTQVPTPDNIYRFPNGTLTGVSAASGNNVWAVGRYPVMDVGDVAVVLHWDGTQWHAAGGPDCWDCRLNAVAAISANSAWAVGSQYSEGRYHSMIAMIGYWDGRGWGGMSSPDVGPLTGIATVSANEAWAVGTPNYPGGRPGIIHWDGSNWGLAAIPDLGEYAKLIGVAAISANDAWAVGSTYSEGGDHTLTLHWNGAAWSIVPSPDVGVLNGITAVSANDVWAVGSAGTLRWNGSNWNLAPSPGVSAAVDAMPSGDVWAVGYGIAHWTGARWNRVTGSTPNEQSSNMLRRVVSSPRGYPANDKWALGTYRSFYRNNSVVERWDGTRWNIVYVSGDGQTMFGLDAVSPNELWVAGYYQNLTYSPYARTSFVHSNGTGWDSISGANVTGTNNYLNDVAAVATDDVWAVGDYGPPGGEQPLIEHWDGSQWSIVPSPSMGAAAYLSRVETISANDVWAVGRYKPTSAGPDQTLTMHWDGALWSVVPSPNVGTDRNYLWSLSAASSNEVWAVGYYGPTSSRQGLILRWEGTKWSVVPSPNPGSSTYLWDVTAHTPGSIWAVGYYVNASTGTVQALAMRWDGSQWVVASSGNAGSGNNFLYSVDTAAPNQVWAVGNYESGGNSLTLAELYSPPFFRDVPPDNPFYTYINALACRGVISGYADGTFRPGNLTTRGQLCKIVVLAEGWALYTPPTPTFRDVPATDPFYSYIETAYNHGIISGYNCGPDCLEFRPGNNVTRGQLCKIVVLAEGWPPYTPPISTFRDVSPGDPFYEHIETAYNHGIISGYNCGPDCLEFRPGNNATRGQICKIVYLARQGSGIRDR